VGAKVEVRASATWAAELLKVAVAEVNVEDVALPDYGTGAQRGVFPFKRTRGSIVE